MVLKQKQVSCLPMTRFFVCLSREIGFRTFHGWALIFSLSLSQNGEFMVGCQSYPQVSNVVFWYNWITYVAVKWHHWYEYANFSNYDDINVIIEFSV